MARAIPSADTSVPKTSLNRFLYSGTALNFLIGLEIVSRDRHVRKRAKGQVRLLAQAALGTEHQQNSRCSGEDDFQAHTGSYDHRQILSMSQESYLRIVDNGLRSP